MNNLLLRVLMRLSRTISRWMPTPFSPLVFSSMISSQMCVSMKSRRQSRIAGSKAANMAHTWGIQSLIFSIMVILLNGHASEIRRFNPHKANVYVDLNEMIFKRAYFPHTCAYLLALSCLMKASFLQKKSTRKTVQYMAIQIIGTAKNIN